MGDLVNSAILGFVVFVLFLSVFWYLDDINRKKELTVQSVQARWGAVDPQVTEIRTSISFNNPHKTNVELTKLEYEVVLADKRVENGTRFQTVRVPAGSNASVQFTARLPPAFLTTWWNTYIEEAETVDFAIRGKAYFSEGAKQTILPFVAQSNWHSSLLAAVSDGLDNCATETTGICIASSNPNWVTTSDGKRGLVLALDFQNPNASTMRIRDLTGRLGVANVSLAEGASAQEISLPPTSDKRIDLVLAVQPSQLRAWWPRHVSACEQSATLTQIRFELRETVEGNDTEPSRETTTMVDWSLPGQPFITRFLCNQETS